MPYEEYFKAASESLIVAGRDGHILEANAKTERLFGYWPKTRRLYLSMAGNWGAGQG
ncbi:MAG: PAS domain-containing protein [Candidatus Binataceae bacterium]